MSIQGKSSRALDRCVLVEPGDPNLASYLCPAVRGLLTLALLAPYCVAVPGRDFTDSAPPVLFSCFAFAKHPLALHDEHSRRPSQFRGPTRQPPLHRPTNTYQITRATCTHMNEAARRAAQITGSPRSCRRTTPRSVPLYTCAIVARRALLSALVAHVPYVNACTNQVWTSKGP